MRWLWTALPGICVLLFAFREIFEDLFHPTETGSLSVWVGRTFFRLLRRSPRALSMAGPLTLITVIFCWAGLQALGFALIYWTGFPHCFRPAPGEQLNASAGGFWTMLYFSVQVMTTLGLGDVLPQSNWIRLLATCQALIGFALVTASVSSIVLIYPALSRMRCLANRIQVLKDAVNKTGIPAFSDDSEILLSSLIVDIIRTRVDFIHFPIIYYFHADRRRSSLPHALLDLEDLAQPLSLTERSSRVRLGLAALTNALDDLARILSRRYLLSNENKQNDTLSIFRAYAEAHSILVEQS